MISPPTHLSRREIPRREQALLTDTDSELSSAKGCSGLVLAVVHACEEEVVLFRGLFSFGGETRQPECSHALLCTRHGVRLNNTLGCVFFPAATGSPGKRTRFFLVFREKNQKRTSSGASEQKSGVVNGRPLSWKSKGALPFRLVFDDNLLDQYFLFS